MMSYFKVAILLLACTIHCDSSKTVQNGIYSFDLKKHYCGELLIIALETVCIEPVNTPVDHIYSKIMSRKRTFRLLVNQCCIKQCSMNFIKENCPENRKIPHSKVVSPANTNHKTTLSPTTTTIHQPSTTTKPSPKAATTTPLTTTTTHRSTTTSTTTTTTRSNLFDGLISLPHGPPFPLGYIV